MAVAMKNAIFWDIETQFLLHRGHIKLKLLCMIEVFMVVTVNNAVFWDVMHAASHSRRPHSL
jgi:hypothetical protein